MFANFQIKSSHYNGAEVVGGGEGKRTETMYNQINFILVKNNLETYYPCT